MSDCFSYVKYLGKYFGQDEITGLLEEFNILKAPKLPKDDYDAYVTNHSVGVDLTFTDENHLNVKNPEFPEGALVLSSIRFIGVTEKKYKKYTGQLPNSLQFGMTRVEVMKLVGHPDDPKYGKDKPLDPDEADWVMRWDREEYCFFAGFDGEKLSEFSIQLPVVRP